MRIRRPVATRSGRLMFGSVYADYPDVLRESLHAMNAGYRRKPPGGIANRLQRLYVRIWGIPEIGFRIRALHFSRALSKLPRNPSRVLDAGSGIGAYSMALAQMYSSAEIVGCELDASKALFCRQLAQKLRVPNLRFIEADISREGAIDDSFDLIICIDVLEHVRNYKGTLSNFARWLKPGGSLYLHTPQSDQKRFLKQFRHWEHPDHVREGFSGPGLQIDLRKAGFDEIDCVETFGTWGRLAWELNHASLKWSLALAALLFPPIYALGRLDLITKRTDGLGLSILARRA